MPNLALIKVASVCAATCTRECGGCKLSNCGTVDGPSALLTLWADQGRNRGDRSGSIMHGLSSAPFHVLFCT
jgi:hypothetical protein